MTVCKIISSGGHICCPFAKGKELLTALRRETFDLFVISDNIVDMQSVTLLDSVRRRFASFAPVLFLASSSNDDEVVLLNSGADDFVVSTIEKNVFLARVASLLRRSYPRASQASMQTLAGIEFDAKKKCVTVKGKSISLTRKEFSLALLLFQHINRAISRSHIMDVIWSRGIDVSARSVDTHVSKLRVKLNLFPEFGYKLAPIYGYGYRLEQRAGSLS